MFFLRLPSSAAKYMGCPLAGEHSRKVPRTVINNHPVMEPSQFEKVPTEAELEGKGGGVGEVSKIELPIREDRCQCGESLGRTWRLWKNAQRKTGLGETTIKL